MILAWASPFKLPKTTVKRYLQKVGHGIMVLYPTTSCRSVIIGGACEIPLKYVWWFI